MVRYGHSALCFIQEGDVSQKEGSHGAERGDGGRQLMDCILGAYISLDLVAIQPNYHSLYCKVTLKKKEEENLPKTEQWTSFPATPLTPTSPPPFPQHCLTADGFS